MQGANGSRKSLNFARLAQELEAAVSRAPRGERELLLLRVQARQIKFPKSGSGVLLQVQEPGPSI